MEVDNQTNNSVGTPIPDNQVPPLNKTKTFSVFAIITCLILLTALIASTYYFLNKINRLTANNQTITTSPPTSEIPTAVITPTVNVSGSVVYFVKDNVLYRLSPLDSAPTVFLKQVDAYAFSPDYQKIAFTKEYGPDTDNSVYIMSLQNNSIEVTIKSEFGDNRGVEWSPRGNYLLVDEGTGPEGGYTVYDANTGKKISSFGDGSHLWLDEQNLFINQQTTVNPSRPYESGDGSSLAKINIITGKSVVLLKADGNTDYSVGTAIDGTCLNYSKYMVTNNNDWGDLTKETTANYCYDLQTGASGTASNQNTDITNSQVKNILVQNESGFTETSSWQVKKNGKYPDWVIVWVNTGGSIYTSDIVIFNLNDPQTTYKKIATGAYVSWY